MDTMRRQALRPNRCGRRARHVFAVAALGILVAACNSQLPVAPQLINQADSSAVSRPSDVRAGDYNGAVEFQGVQRTFILHVPPNHDGRTALPLVVMLHGGFGSAVNAARDYGWPAKADAEGFYALFPDGLGTVQTWNAEHCCGFALDNNVDDVGFLRELIGGLGRLLPIDSKRVFATGMSNGAMLSYRLGAEASDLFAAIAPVEGTIGGQVDARFPVVQIPTPKGPIPLIIFHGTADMSVLYSGGPSQSPVSEGRIDLSVAEAVQFWISANQTATTPVTDTSASGNVIKDTYAAMGTRGDVVLYTIVGQGHAWAGGLKPFPAADPPSTEISATDAIWEFFKNHAMP